jgi:hypothetical protein
MAFVSLDSPSCEVPYLILHSVVFRDVTRQATGLHCLKYVGALEKGLAYLSRCNSGWFYHSKICRKPPGSITSFQSSPTVIFSDLTLNFS